MSPSGTAAMEVDSKLADALAKLTQQQVMVGELIKGLTEQNPGTAKASKAAIAHPEPFKGGSSNARRFIHYFTLWAGSQGPPLNTSAGGTPNEEQWIASALSLLQGEAAIWAVPYLQKLQDRRLNSTKPPPFKDWTDFCDQFKKRFQGVDDAAQAQRELERCKQGTRTVPEYSARFQEIAPCTGYSDQDLMVRYKQGLTNEAKQWLALATLVKEVSTLTDLVTLANDCDFKMRNTHNNIRNYSAPLPDGVPMDIDATRVQSTPSGRTRAQFLEAMRGRCYGCGSTGHSKKDGNHANLKCTYCSRFGHMEGVCQDKFMGLGRNRGLLNNRRPQRVAATPAPFTLFPEETQVAASVTADSSATSSSPSILPDLSKLQNAIAEQNRMLSLLVNNQSF